MNICRLDEVRTFLSKVLHIFIHPCSCTCCSLSMFCPKTLIHWFKAALSNFFLLKIAVNNRCSKKKKKVLKMRQPSAVILKASLRRQSSLLFFSSFFSLLHMAHGLSGPYEGWWLRRKLYEVLAWWGKRTEREIRLQWSWCNPWKRWYNQFRRSTLTIVLHFKKKKETTQALSFVLIWWVWQMFWHHLYKITFMEQCLSYGMELTS